MRPIRSPVVHWEPAGLCRMPVQLVHRRPGVGTGTLIGLCARNQGKLTKKMYGAKQQNGYAVNLHVASNSFSSGIILSPGEITTLQHLAAVRPVSAHACSVTSQTNLCKITAPLSKLEKPSS